MGRAPMEKTEEELTYVKQSLILPIVLDVLAHDIRVLQSSKAKMNGLYAKYLNSLQDKASLELYHLRRQLRQQHNCHYRASPCRNPFFHRHLVLPHAVSCIMSIPTIPL